MSQSNRHRAAEPLTEATNQIRGTALTLGLIGVALTSVATIMVVWGSSDFGSPSVGVLIRVAGILFAIALVFPTLRKPSMKTLGVAGVGLVLVLLRPGLIWAALLGWAGWVFFGRQPKTSDNDA